MRKLNILITTLILLAIMPMVLGTLTTVSPVTYGNYSGTMLVNCTKVNTDSPTNITRVYLVYNASGGAVNSTTILTTITVAGTDNTTVWVTPSITGLTDGTNYTMACLFGNGTTNGTAASKTSITIDNTNPTCSIKIKSPRISYKGIQDVIWESADALSLASTAVTVDRPQTGSDLSYTDVSRTLTLLSTDTNYWGDWNTTVLAKDRPGNACSASTTFKSYLPDGDIEEAYEQEESKSDLKGLLIVIGIGVGLYFLFKDK